MNKRSKKCTHKRTYSWLEEDFTGNYHCAGCCDCEKVWTRKTICNHKWYPLNHEYSICKYFANMKKWNIQINLTLSSKQGEKEEIMNNTNKPIGSHDNPIRYENLSKKDPNYKKKLKGQLAKFIQDAKAGKVLCLSDLMINAGM